MTYLYQQAPLEHSLYTCFSVGLHNWTSHDPASDGIFMQFLGDYLPLSELFINFAPSIVIVFYMRQNQNVSERNGHIIAPVAESVQTQEMSSMLMAFIQRTVGSEDSFPCQIMRCMMGKGTICSASQCRNSSSSNNPLVRADAFCCSHRSVDEGCFGQMCSASERAIVVGSQGQKGEKTKSTHEQMQLNLFADEIFDIPTITEIPKFRENITGRPARYLPPTDASFLKLLTFTSKHHMPLVKGYDGPIPQQLVAFYRLRGLHDIVGICPMFYTSDAKIEYVVRHFLWSITTFAKYQYVMSPDFSVYRDMPRPLQVGNLFMNKLITAIWQYYGLNVIPSVSWASMETIEEDLEGFPKHSIIGINSTGVGWDKKSKCNWIEGYRAVNDILEPSAILRYGARQKGECEDISIYYDNNNRSFRKH